MTEYDESSNEKQRNLNNDPSWYKTTKRVGALSCLSGAVLAGVSFAQGEYVLASGFISLSFVVGNLALKEAQTQIRLELEFSEDGS